MNTKTYGPYERFVATNFDLIIQANVVYEKVSDGTIGCYSGYSGGGVTDYRFFYINKDDEVLITDDEQQIESEAVGNEYERFAALQRERSDFEFYDDEEEDETSKLSEKGVDFLSEGTLDESTNIKSAKTKGFSEDVIYKLQQEWTLTFYLE